VAATHDTTYLYSEDYIVYCTAAYTICGTQAATLKVCSSFRIFLPHQLTFFIGIDICFTTAPRLLHFRHSRVCVVI